MTRSLFAAAAALLTISGAASAQVVFENIWNNGFFTPFNSSTPASVRYGDSGWIGTGSSAPVTLNKIVMTMVVAAPTGGADIPAGTTDITFTFNDGDPSGLVFGSSAQLFSTTITGVQLPAVAAGGLIPIEVEVPLPGVTTLGGFNNVGWSVGVQNFAFGGDFGFAVSTAFGQTTGFYTSNASFFDGTSWSLFSFSGDPNTGVANYVARIEVPAPGGAAVLAIAGLMGARRRRR